MDNRNAQIYDKNGKIVTVKEVQSNILQIEAMLELSLQDDNYEYWTDLLLKLRSLQQLHRN